MCRFTIDLLDYDKLTAKEKRTLLRQLQGEKKALQSQLEFVEESLKGVDQSIKVLERKM
jgi:uncharacterized protein HemX